MLRKYYSCLIIAIRGTQAKPGCNILLSFAIGPLRSPDLERQQKGLEPLHNQDPTQKLLPEEKSLVYAQYIP